MFAGEASLTQILKPTLFGYSTGGLPHDVEVQGCVKGEPRY